MLKMLEDALADGDQIHAIVRGSAINNDGSSKASYTSPSVSGQAEVIAQALINADVTADTVSYVEAHGTGTRLGDPIEVAGLCQAYAPHEPMRQGCALGSVKTNFGHLIAAAGVAGFIKTVLALQHKTLPPSLHFSEPNPEINFDESPFYTNASLRPWQAGSTPRRAGVSSFGVGGTNAHVVLEEAPPAALRSHCCNQGEPQILTLSARSETALLALADTYRTLINRENAPVLADLCYSANTGRASFDYRFCAVGNGTDDISAQLDDVADRLVHTDPNAEAKICFMFTGQGSQYVRMGESLYLQEPLFRNAIDRCDEILRPLIGASLASVLYPKSGDASPIDETCFTQPALFAVEYALAELWAERGITPSIVMGHSVGEYVAACIAGVFGLEDGLKLVAERGRLIQALPRTGAMLAVKGRRNQVEAVIAETGEPVEIAAINGPLSLVLSGRTDAVEAVRARLAGAEVESARLDVSHAFHSALMDPILDAFGRFAAGISYNPPTLDLISNLTGQPVQREIACADYWVEHIRRPVEFQQSVRAAQDLGATHFVELGPRPVLSGMGQACAVEPAGASIHWIPSLRPPTDDRQQLLLAMAQLHLGGVPIAWRRLYRTNEHRRVDVPTYPFQRKHHWVGEAGQPQPSWFSRVEWHRQNAAAAGSAGAGQPGAWLMLASADATSAAVCGQLEQAGHTCIRIEDGRCLERAGSTAWRLDPSAPDQWQRLLEEVRKAVEKPLLGAIHMASIAGPAVAEIGQGNVAEAHEPIIGSIIAMTRALASQVPDPAFRLWLVTSGAVPAVGPTSVSRAVAQAPVWGIGKVIAAEHPDLWGGLVDLDPEATAEGAGILVRHIMSGSREDQVAIRSNELRAARLITIDGPPGADHGLDPEATYLITGGLGGLGSQVAHRLIRNGARHLVLVGRSMASEAKQKALHELQETGADVRFGAVDVADCEALAGVFASIDDSGHALGGIIHTAGVLEDAVVTTATWDSFARVMAPKVAGTLALHRLAAGRKLEFFVCFSSISAILGMKGQASYAAANSVMDALIEVRRQHDLPGTSIAWGPWNDAGMAAALDDRLRLRLADFGLGSIDMTEGLDRLEELMWHGGTIAAAPVDWPTYVAQHGAEIPPFLSALPSAGPAAVPERDPGRENGLAADLSGLAPEAQLATVTELLRGKVAQTLGVGDPGEISLTQPLNRMGFDSLMTIEFRNAIKKIGATIPLEMLVVGISVERLAAEVLMQLSPQPPTTGEHLSAPKIAQESDEVGVEDRSCVIIPKPNPEASVRLIGFPYAGGGPMVFQSWADKLPDYIELGIIQLPGRSARLREPFYNRMEQLVESLTPDLVPFLDKPFAFFGHCVGGAQCYEVSQRLRHDYNLEPVHLFVAGGRSPHIYNENQFSIDILQFNHETGVAEHELGEEDFVEMLREVNFANNKALFEDRDMRQIMLPIIFADYEINNNYIYLGHKPLSTPITAIGGRIDPYVTGEHILGWRRHTTGEFKSHFCAGDHYFMETQGDLLTQIAASELARFNGAAGATGADSGGVSAVAHRPIEAALPCDLPAAGNG